ncbi:MAG TPA: uroporphyrinogen decarboxylase family protein [Spirochaetota bacterium]|nr:uroporphyrinogen decarboxylase family protein [Spirochaetota bacterium]
MKRNMREWVGEILSSNKRRAFPLMVFSGAELTHATVDDMLSNARIQASCLAALAARYPSAALITAMDLSVEAEAFGAEVRRIPNEPPTITGSLVKDADGAHALSPPSVGSGRSGIYLEAAALTASAVTDRPVFGCHIGPFSLAGRLCGMTEALMNVHAEPETLHVVIRKATGFLVEYARAFRGSGVNGLVIAEPAAGLISPAHCDEFSSGYIRSIVEAVQDDHFMIILHNCAASGRHVGSMASTGAMGLHFGNAADMAEVLGVVPSGTLAFGNIDPAGILKNGTEESVHRTTAELLMKTALHPNFVLSSGCDIPPGTPPGNIDALFRALDDYNAAAPGVKHAEPVR